MADRKRRARRRARPRQAVRTERYNIRTLHEDREYGLYWYAWVWKILRPVLIFLCSLLIVIGMVNFGYNKVYDNFLGPVDAQNTARVRFDIESGQSVTSIGASAFANCQNLNLLELPAAVRCRWAAVRPVW